MSFSLIFHLQYLFLQADEHVRIFSGEGSYKLIPVEKGMSVRYITQLMAEKHRVKLTAKYSLLEYNPELATERILEDHENVCEVVLSFNFLVLIL